ncbi:hypothetical protein SAMN06265380_11162 [Ruegeria faecimaris]|uniref:Uncharacterized protein n=1 Tax=Ruegeria faecimaris TaxID=686389 RepID=A0A521EHL6_9RHOB|nr:hypothetical protein SAMN06265380_11162 [Ruegeria faecimaris]
MGSEPSNASAECVGLQTSLERAFATRAILLILRRLVRYAVIRSSAAVVRVTGSETGLGAQPVPWIFSLLALAASGMPSEQQVRCRYAAEATVIHTGCSENHTWNSQVADEAETGQLRG